MKHLSETFNRDCVEAMKEYPDNYFDLAIVDPPYGIGIDVAMNTNKGKQGFKLYNETNWDSAIPTIEYWDELDRVSKNQIVWGGNYFIEQINKNSQGWIVWNKVQREFTMSDAELAWTSFDKTIRVFDLSRGGAMGDHNKYGEKMHPTQKPVKLYEWILKNYAKEGDLILDTHLGSGSSRIAAHKSGLDFTGFELDKEYFEQGNKRFKDFLTVYEQEVGKEKILNNQTRLF
jgi:site-specific DNA-methyltransferase (adenine-specific)